MGPPLWLALASASCGNLLSDALQIATIELAPNWGRAGATVNITLSFPSLAPDTVDRGRLVQLDFGPGIGIGPASALGGGRIAVEILVSANAAEGPRTVSAILATANGTEVPTSTLFYVFVPSDT